MAPAKSLLCRLKARLSRLPPILGLTITVAIGENSGANRLAVGMGTNRTITGMDGKYPFPVFGSVACEIPGGYHVRCKGKGFAYVLFDNRGNVFGINNSPKFTINKIGGYAGSRCEEDWLGYSGHFYWLEPGITGRPKGTSVTLPSLLHGGVSLQPNQFAVFAFHCY